MSQSCYNGEYGLMTTTHIDTQLNDTNSNLFQDKFDKITYFKKCTQCYALINQYYREIGSLYLNCSLQCKLNILQYAFKVIRFIIEYSITKILFTIFRY